MSIFSKFEGKVEDVVDGAAGAVFKAPIEPAQIAKRAEKQMKREKLIGSGRQYAPTLYNVLVNPRDDKRLFGFYPTMASEIETYLYAKGTDAGMEFDTRPLVRFIVDKGLKSGKFDVIAENVAAPIIGQLRDEELEYYGIKPKTGAVAAAAYNSFSRSGDELDFEDEDADDVAAGRGGAARPVVIPLVSQPIDGLDLAVNPQQQPGNAVLPAFASGAEAAVIDGGSGGSGSSEFAEAEDLSNQPAIGNALLYNVGESQKIYLELRRMTAGRGKDNNIVLADANASRVHVQFSQDATGKWKLKDLGSTNGSLLNGKPVTTAILRNNDEITVGTTILEFRQ